MAVFWAAWLKKRMLKDNFGREINYLRVSVTDRCNLRCIYCLPKEGVQMLPHSEIMSYEEILRFVKILAGLGINKVRLTGGEPLLRSGIIDFIKEMKMVSGLNDLSLTTNGIIFREKLGELFEAGLRRVNISVNTLKKERYAHITGAENGCLAKIINGIDEALNLGMDPVKINVVVLKGINDDEVLDFVKLAKDKDMHVRFIEFMPIRENGGSWNKWFVSSETVRSIIEDKYGKDYSRVSFISPISSCFCKSCNRLRLTSDGKLRLCLFSDDEVDLKTVMRRGATDQDIVDLVKMAVSKKPEKSQVTSHTSQVLRKCRRTMAEIGG